MNSVPDFYVSALPVSREDETNEGADASLADRPMLLPVAKPLDAYMDFYVSTWHHVGYAATWFSLSAATALMTMLRLKRRR